MQILEVGDALYTESCNILKAKDKYTNPQLYITEVVSRFTVLDRDISLYIEDCAVNGILTAPDEDGNEPYSLKQVRSQQ